MCRQFGEFCHLSVCETVWIQFDEFVYQCVSQCGYSLLNCVLCAVFDPPLPHSPHISYIPQVLKDMPDFGHGPYVGGTNSLFNCVYFLNEDNIEKTSMCRAETGLSDGLQPV